MKSIIHYLTGFCCLLGVASGVSCSEDPTTPAGVGEVTITSQSINENSIIFKLAATDVTATMYAYQALPKGETITGEKLSASGEKSAIATKEMTVGNLKAETDYTLYAVSIGEKGVSAVAAFDFKTMKGVNPETEFSVGIGAKDITPTAATVFFKPGKGLEFYEVMVMPEVLMQNEIINAKRNGQDITIDGLAYGWLIGPYGSMLAGEQEKDLSWYTQQALLPDTEYRVMVLGFKGESDYGEVSTFIVKTAAFDKLIGAPSLSVAADPSYEGVYFTYTPNADCYHFSHFFALKSEYDYTMENQGEEFLRQIIRNMSPRYDGEAGKEYYPVGYDKAGTQWLSMGLAADKNWMPADKINMTPFTIMTPDKKNLAKYDIKVTETTASSAKLDFMFKDSCAQVAFRIVPPSVYNAELTKLGAQGLARDIYSNGGWVISRGKGNRNKPNVLQQDFTMDLNPNTEYVLVATGLNYFGGLADPIAFPLTTKPMTWEGCTGEVNITIPTVGRTTITTNFYYSADARLCYFRTLDATDPVLQGTEAEIIEWMQKTGVMGNSWDNVNVWYNDLSYRDDADPDGNVPPQYDNLRWAGMTPGTKYTTIWIVEDHMGRMSKIRRVDAETIKSDGGANPVATMEVHSVKTTQKNTQGWMGTLTTSTLINTDVAYYYTAVVPRENFAACKNEAEIIAALDEFTVRKTGFPTIEESRNRKWELHTSESGSYIWFVKPYGASDKEGKVSIKLIQLPTEVTAAGVNFASRYVPTPNRFAPKAKALPIIDRQKARKATLRKEADLLMKQAQAQPKADDIRKIREAMKGNPGFLDLGGNLAEQYLNKTKQMKQ